MQVIPPYLFLVASYQAECTMPLLQVMGTVNSACRCLGPELPTLQVDLEMVQGNLGGRRLDQKQPQTAWMSLVTGSALM